MLRTILKRVCKEIDFSMSLTTLMMKLRLLCVIRTKFVELLMVNYIYDQFLTKQTWYIILINPLESIVLPYYGKDLKWRGWGNGVITGYHPAKKYISRRSF